MLRLLIFPLVLSACISTTNQANDFDLVCHYFEALEKSPQQISLSHKERNQFIVKKINQNLDPQSDAKIAWEAISRAVSEQRYELFKSGAESVLKNKWECKAMKRLANVTGVFE